MLVLSLLVPALLLAGLLGMNAVERWLERWSNRGARGRSGRRD